jgi:cytochrome c-type biogenesis protein CcmF
VQRCRTRQAPWRAFFALPAAYLGQHLAHLGFAVTIVGVTLVSLNTVDLHTRMAPGDETDVAGYHFKFVAAVPLQGPNYDGTEAQFEITRAGQLPLRLSAEKRNYRVRAMPMIDAGLTRDLYISLGEPLDGAAWSVRLSVKPFVRWLWLGAIMMAAGGLTALLDPRFRRVSARRAARRNEEQRVTS